MGKGSNKGCSVADAVYCPNRFTYKEVKLIQMFGSSVCEDLETALLTIGGEEKESVGTVVTEFKILLKKVNSLIKQVEGDD